MRSSSLLVFCGCNAVFGLAPTQQQGDYFDAHIDARFMCPAIGTPPRFSSSFRQVVLQPCSDYSVSTRTGQALASCIAGASVIEEGAIDDTMTPAPGFQDPNFAYSNPRLGPDGDVAVAQVYDRTARVTTYQLFERTAAGWLAKQQLAPGFTISSTTAPTRTTPRRMIAIGPGGLHELVETSGAWVDNTTFTFTELGVTSLNYQLSLTPDGRRLVFFGYLAGQAEGQLLYADRASVDDRFSLAVPLPGIEFLFHGFLTEDCGRVYFSAFGSVFYAPRE